MSGRPAAPVVVLTRAAGDNGALAALGRSLGAEVRELPSLRTVALSLGPAHAAAARSLARTDVVAFASRAGVRAFADLLAALGATLPARAACWAVGPATGAAVARTLGRRASLPPHFDAQHLALAIAAALTTAPARILLPGAAQGRATLGDALAAAGHEVVRLPVYATVSAPPRRPPVTWDARVHYIVCASPSGVAGFLAQAELPRHARFLSIGPTTSAALRARGLPVYAQAGTHDAAGLAAVLTTALESP